MHYARPAMPADAFTLPAKHYIDDGYFRDELERVFLGGWFWAGRADQIPEPGDYRLVTIADESLILVRDRDGRVHCHYNVCRHRGTRLCEAAQGRFAETISCPYHAWTYRLDGGLAGAPHMDDTAGFRKEEYPLRGVAVADWDGHLWLNLHPSPPPLSEQLGSSPDKFQAWGMRELRLGHRIVYDVRANWKLILQNYSECLHCPINHPALKRYAHYLSGDNETPEGDPNDFGGSMDLYDGVETMSSTGKRRRLLGSLNASQERKVYFYVVMPNLLLTLHPDYMMTHALWPQAPDRTQIVCDWHYHPDDLAQPGFDPQNEVAFWDQTNREDWRLSELTQQGLRSRAYVPGPYSCREDLLLALDRWILNRMSAGAPGRIPAADEPINGNGGR